MRSSDRLRTEVIRIVRLAGLGAAACLLAAPALAQELRLSGQFEAEYNSNFRGEENDPDAAISNRFGPRVQIIDPHGRLTYDLTYRGYFNWVIDENGFNDYENTLSGNLEYALGPRTQVRIFDSFRDISNIRYSAGELDDNSDQVGSGSDDFKRNTFSAEIEHQFTRRLSSLLRFGYDLVDFEQNITRGDSHSFSVGGNVLYGVTRADSVGIGGAFLYQDFDGFSTLQGQESQSYESFLTWQHRFTDGFRFSIRGGPSIVVSDITDTVEANNAPLQVVQRIFFDPNDPMVLFPGSRLEGVPYFDPALNSETYGIEPVGGPNPQLGGVRLERNGPAVLPIVSLPTPADPSIPAVPANFGSRTYPITGVGFNSTDVTFNASATISRRWDEFNLRMTYTRNQATAAGDSGAATLDRVRLALDWEPNQRWNAYGGMSWSRRKRLTEPLGIEFAVAADDPANPTYAVREAVVGRNGKGSNQNNLFTVLAGARMRMTRQIHATGEIRYNYQDRERSGGIDRSAHIAVLVIRFSYTATPIRIPDWPL